MPMRKLILLLVALIIAGATVMLAHSMMTGNVNNTSGMQAAPVQKTHEVLVAARDLPSGTLIKEADLKWQIWPADDEASGFAVKGKNETSEFVGAVVRQGLRLGEPILNGRVVKTHEQGFMSAVLNPGMRAVSISLTPIGGVAGFVFPGDRVDVILAHQVTRKTDAESTGRKVSETMLKNVRVLALDQKTDDQTSEPKIAQTATLEVTPKQAEKLALVAELGTLSLALRSIANAPDEPPALSNAAGQESLSNSSIAVDDDKSYGMTWDSDISQVLSKPGNRFGAVQHIQIMRGKELTESSFDLQQ